MDPVRLRGRVPVKIVDIQECVASISSPEVFAPFGGFADSTPVENGMIALPDVPGVGFEAKSDLMDRIRSLFGPLR